jgi:hypothetical protein
LNLEQFIISWKDTVEDNKAINDRFTSLVNGDDDLKNHRTWVEQNIFGFGERSFHWLHKIVVDDMPEQFSFLEIGGFRMQVVSLYELLAKRTGRIVDRTVISPMSGAGGHWESDYFADSKRIHEQFNLAHGYVLIHGLSTSLGSVAAAENGAPYNIVYIDGGHDSDTVRFDMAHYTDMVKVGGYLICDDCSNGLKMWPGSFPGIMSVSIEVDTYMAKRKDFIHLGAVMHNRIWKRISASV